MKNLRTQLPHYLALIRFGRPIGTYLLLWPTLWALWLAAEGLPDFKLLIIFILGTFFMRSAGCVINDYADRNFDGGVERTKNRPLVTGTVSTKEALLLCATLSLLSFILVLFTNIKTILLSFVALILAASYPFMKRYTHYPQLVLGLAFAWAIPMAFSAQKNELPHAMWLIYIATVLWTIVYDTFYAMVDRDEDIVLGLKSTAIVFGKKDILITRLLQACVITVLIFVGIEFKLNHYYFISIAFTAGLFVYQQYLIRHRERERCFKAFLHNQWVGVTIFAGIFFHFAISG